MAVISCAYGDPRAAVIDWLKQENLWQEVTPLERKFLKNEVDERTRRAFTWKIEALIPLLWAINKIDEIPGIKTQCDTEPLKQAVIWSPNPTKDYIGS